MAPEHFIEALVPRGIIGFFKLCPSLEQDLDNSDVIGSALVTGRPKGLAENRTAVHVCYFKRNFSFNQQLDNIQVSTRRGVMKSVQSGVVPRKRIDALIQQELNVAGSTQHASPGERLLHRHLRLARRYQEIHKRRLVAIKQIFQQRIVARIEMVDGVAK